jgi:DNA-binding HxlR family transcriptional regulator
MEKIDLRNAPDTGAWQNEAGFWAKVEEAGANPECDIRRLLRVVLNRWAPLILLNLVQEPRRFGELRRRIPTLSQKVMTQNLRALEEASLISRSVVDTSPPKLPMRSCLKLLR